MKLQAGIKVMEGERLAREITLPPVLSFRALSEGINVELTNLVYRDRVDFTRFVIEVENLTV